jgi:hypothetical protein
MNINKAITYSLLAHIRNRGTLIKGPLDIFVPLVKRVLSHMNSEGVHQGSTILEIQSRFLKMYQIDIPLPVLSNILNGIASEYNTSEIKGFRLHKDNSFIIEKYIFDDFEETIQKSADDAEQVEKMFQKYCSIYDVKVPSSKNVFNFIEKNKLQLAKYLSNSSKITNGEDFTVEAQFVDFFRKIPSAYEYIRRIYLGSILSCYLEYKTEQITKSTELLLDTNFIISLIDLNTIEATHTCQKLIEVGKKQGYKFSILCDTIEETQYLLRKKAENLDFIFLQSRINPEDIYNACERRKINKADLERIADNLESILFNMRVITIPVTTKYSNLAKNSSDLTNLTKVRNSYKSALHDATALHYVREKRGNKRIKEFEKVNCWFVHNSNTTENEKYNTTEKNQPEVIKADELLNIMWLSSPSISKDISEVDISDIGLNSIVAFTLNQTLPKSSIIKELDDNIQKYALENITDDDVLLISSRIVNRQLNNIQGLNELAEKDDKTQFIEKLKKEAQKQRELEAQKQKEIETLLKELRQKIEGIEIKREDIQIQEIQIKKENKEKDKEFEDAKIELEKERQYSKDLAKRFKEEKIENYKNEKIKEWRNKSWWYLAASILSIILCIIYTYSTCDWKSETVATKLTSLKENIICSTLFALISLIFSSVIIKNLNDKYTNFSNIKAFKESIKIPDELNKI